MENGALELQAGNEIIVSTKQVLGTLEKFSVSYEPGRRRVSRVYHPVG